MISCISIDTNNFYTIIELQVFQANVLSQVTNNNNHL